MTTDPDPPIAAPPRFPTVNGAFSVTRDGSGPLSRGEARGAGYEAVTRGARLHTGAPDLDLGRISARALVCATDGVITDVSAAKVWGLPLPRRMSGGRTSISTTPGGAHPDRRGVRGRRLDLPVEHITTRHHLRTTTPARTWLDCSPVLDEPSLVAIGDAVLHRHLATVSELAGIVEWGKGRRGVTRARRCLAWLDARAESPGESWVRAHLRAAGLPAPECNADIVVRGEWLARADLSWPAARLIVEYDGAVHSGPRQRRRDARRLNLLQQAGWLVIVLTADDLRQPWLMVGLVAGALRDRMP